MGFLVKAPDLKSGAHGKAVRLVGADDKRALALVHARSALP